MTKNNNMPSILWVSSQIGNKYTTNEKDLYDCCDRMAYHSDTKYQKLVKENKRLRKALDTSLSILNECKEKGLLRSRGLVVLNDLVKARQALKGGDDE